MSLEIWVALLGTAILISLSPGASAATAMGAGLTYGIRGAGWSTLGLVCGYGVQILVVCLGLGSLLATAPEWFEVLRWIGVGYLTWLGIQFWRQRKSADIESQTFAPRHTRFFQALLVNITNPKGLVFLLALIPQFIDPVHPQLPQLLIISATLMLSEAFIMTGYSGLASGLRQRFADPVALMWQQRLTGCALIAAALALSATAI
ncbi:LysE family transporter [Marinobacterium sediminicola]|uniref:Homoserine/homoserine lactone efflux protein n=1 Tax=Marinobacterium sediminicola TaxID=518898 RepID=A0ABY1RZU9_9GAMM|nr:LysE family transporter [Marinobacterium sediminicola]ULG69940.1 LysE family transporter [Marinobacterium sediminicola]SMR74390.1 homoserine/homoserine lactone efflux protein [Marinobacterium sediminicola]